jgi:hypothetical protein
MADELDREIERAFEIGKDNEEVIQLAHNWCGHLKVVKSGGTGLIEVQTGLPIGMRHFECPHAAAGGFAGMVMRDIVLDFYDRNCVGCKYRATVRLPNLTQLAAERDERNKRTRDAQAKASQDLNAAIAKRAEHRTKLSAGSNPPTLAIFEAIDKFDQEPSQQNGEVLLQVAEAAQSHFTMPVNDALWDLAESPGGSRAEIALGVLEKTSADKRRLCRLSLRLLASAHSRIAARIVSQLIEKEDEDLVPSALPVLISLAAPVETVFHTTIESMPEPLLAAYRVAPEDAHRAIRDMLRSTEKRARIAAVTTVKLIAQVEPSFGLSVSRELMSALSLPDDHYGPEGSAEGKIVGVLASQTRRTPREMDKLISEQIANAGEDERPSYYKVYRRILRPRHRARSREAGPAEKLAFARLLELLTQIPRKDLLDEVLEFSRHDAPEFPDLVDQSSQTLLGAIALYADESDRPSNPLANLDPRPDILQAMEASSRRQTLRYILEACTELIGASVTRNPETTGTAILQTLENLGASHVTLRASLIECLGHVHSDHLFFPKILPALYGAMSDPSQVVRAAAVRSYGKIAASDASDLPALLHESFLLSLLDPYVIVQSAGIEALDAVTLPDNMQRRANGRVLVLIGGYRQERSLHHLIKRAIEVFLGTRPKNEKLPNGIRDFLLDTAATLRPYDAAEILLRYAWAFRGTEKFTEILVRLIGDPEVAEYRIEDLLDCLAECGPAEILAVSEALRESIKNSGKRGFGASDRVIELLTSAGAFQTAHAVAHDQTASLEDTTWDKPRKLRARLRETAVEIELAAANGNTNKIMSFTQQWRALEKEIAEDDKKNEKKRSPFFGLSSQDSGD